MRCEVSDRECPTLDEHHIIPREYGGIDGPTIWLDPALHQAIHRYTNNRIKLAKFLANYPAEVRARTQTLVTALKEAETTLERAQTFTITFNLSEAMYDKLSALAKETGSSENQLAKKLLSNLLS